MSASSESALTVGGSYTFQMEGGPIDGLAVTVLDQEENGMHRVQTTSESLTETLDRFLQTLKDKGEFTPIDALGRRIVLEEAEANDYKLWASADELTPVEA